MFNSRILLIVIMFAHYYHLFFVVLLYLTNNLRKFQEVGTGNTNSYSRIPGNKNIFFGLIPVISEVVSTLFTVQFLCNIADVINLANDSVAPYTSLVTTYMHSDERLII